MKAPCKDCDAREIGCHGKCEDYKHYKAHKLAEWIYATRNKRKEELADRVHFDNVTRTQKRARHR
jgi:hypothetical protein